MMSSQLFVHFCHPLTWPLSVDPVFQQKQTADNKFPRSLAPYCAAPLESRCYFWLSNFGQSNPELPVNYRLSKLARVQPSITIFRSRGTKMGERFNLTWTTWLKSMDLLLCSDSETLTFPTWAIIRVRLKMCKALPETTLNCQVIVEIILEGEEARGIKSTKSACILVFLCAGKWQNSSLLCLWKKVASRYSSLNPFFSRQTRDGYHQ